jgi:hypothetical protein
MTESSQMDTVETLFFSAKLKIEWANIHIGYLNTLLRNISADETYRMGIEHDPKTGKYRLKVEGAQNIPADFPLLTGDIIHHLRCALDHTATAIVGMESTTIYVPFHERKEKFVTCSKVRAINQACPGLGDYVVAELEPYNGGRRGLWPMTKLDAVDKHKLIVTVLGVTSVWFEKITDENGGVWANCAASVHNDTVLFPFGSTGKMKIEGKVQPSFDIFFGQGTFFEDQPIIPTLANLSQAVSESIGAIAQFVRDAGGVIGRNPDHRAAS